MSDWISVKERLPNGIGDVLMFSVSGRMSVEGAVFLRKMVKAAEIEKDECYYTHWMPLPEPPK